LFLREAQTQQPNLLLSARKFQRSAGTQMLIRQSESWLIGGFIPKLGPVWEQQSRKATDNEATQAVTSQHKTFKVLHSNNQPANLHVIAVVVDLFPSSRNPMNETALSLDERVDHKKQIWTHLKVKTATATASCH
jgi:hypothetical protein